ncbi:hypothetical protein T484DRAFT_1804025 [Baffinella frigidus]|nr:hypothetical protein T484DRAFT_1804025 [Cryptophyta sp. CCMP2293]
MSNITDPVETTPAAVQPTDTNVVAPSAGNDVNAMMMKMADQQHMISQLNEQLATKDADVKALSAKSRAEMQNLYSTVIEKWVDTLDTTSDQSRQEFKNGMMRLADNAEDQNGIWQVVMCASSAAKRDRESAAIKEQNFQELTKNYDELKTRVGGGNFMQQENRVSGHKRPAENEATRPEKNNIWDDFSSYMKTSYSNDSFSPPMGFTAKK